MRRSSFLPAPWKWSRRGLSTAGAMVAAAGLGVCLSAQSAPAAPAAPPSSAAPPTSQAAPQAPKVPLIRTTTTLVAVPVLVLDKKGQPMDVLGRSDFQIYDNGKLQKISNFDDEPRPLSLAIVVDTGDYDAVGQAKRSAALIASMVVGAAGEASVFIGGPQPKQVLAFTNDGAKLTTTLRHLKKSPTAPLGQGSIVEPLNLAVLDLKKQPRDRERAVLIISKQSGQSGEGAQAVLESGMSDAIPIFRVAPNRPANTPAYVNPDSPDQRGVGQGSQRTIHPASPVDSRGNPVNSAGDANLNLMPIIGAARSLAKKVLTPHSMDFVYASGGMAYKAGNDGDFDQKLSLIGDELRAIYHLYYSPDDLASANEIHQITVRLDVPATASVGQMTYRRTYLGVQAH